MYTIIYYFRASIQLLSTIYAKLDSSDQSSYHRDEHLRDNITSLHRWNILQKRNQSASSTVLVRTPFWCNLGRRSLDPVFRLLIKPVESIERDAVQKSLPALGSRIYPVPGCSMETLTPPRHIKYPRDGRWLGARGWTRNFARPVVFTHRFLRISPSVHTLHTRTNPYRVSRSYHPSV